MSHLTAPDGTIVCNHADGHDHLDNNDHDHAHEHEHDEGHGHTHGLVDRSILRSPAGIKAVLLSLLFLALAASAQVAIFALSGSVALLADLIHNFGDALTAIPLGIAFILRSARGEKLGGLGVVLAIFVSACVALYETVQRFIHPQPRHRDPRSARLRQEHPRHTCHDPQTDPPR